MKEQLNCILLIDDNEHDNFFHKTVIADANCCKRVIAIESAEQALDYLKSENEEDYINPDIIFLDINMPRMNGWEFLNKYKLLNAQIQGDIVVIMLSTSLNPEDKEKADGIGEINDYINKPLTVESLMEILQKHFPDRM